MYNRYIPNGTAYTRVTEEDGPPPPPPRQEPIPERGDDRVPPTVNPPRQTSGLSGLLKKLKLDDLDTGDILLLLILLFLFLEGDDIELVIALGLMLIMGLN